LAPDVSGNEMPWKIRDPLSHWPASYATHSPQWRPTGFSDQCFVNWSFVSVTYQLWCVAAYCATNMKLKLLLQSFDINLLENRFLLFKIIWCIAPDILIVPSLGFISKIIFSFTSIHVFRLLFLKLLSGFSCKRIFFYSNYLHVPTFF